MWRSIRKQLKTKTPLVTRNGVNMKYMNKKNMKIQNKAVDIHTYQQRYYQNYNNNNNQYHYNYTENIFNATQKALFMVSCAYFVALAYTEWISQDGSLLQIAEAKMYNDEEEDRVVMNEFKSNVVVLDRDTPASLQNGDIPIYRILLTGGPCAGKSTAMTILRNRLSELGFDVYCMPEIATMFIGSGVRFPQFGPMTTEQILELQTCMVKAQLLLEDIYYSLARSTKEPSIILCDRGVIDGRAYMTPLEFRVMLDTNDWNLSELRDERYDCVIHMVTAAIGAEKFYTLENNTARSEGLYRASMIDKKLREVYIGHPYLFVVNNSTGFEEKIDKVVNIVGGIIGMPKRTSDRRKFLLAGEIEDDSIPVPFETIEIEHIFLDNNNKNEQRGIRKRTYQHINSYSIVTRIQSVKSHEETNVFRRLTPKMYMAFMKQADPSKRPVKKSTRSFVWGDHYYTICQYHLKREEDKHILIVEASINEEEQAVIPDFLRDYIIEEVTPTGEVDPYSTHYFSEYDVENNYQQPRGPYAAPKREQ
mmetsp:Transcript_12964/g.19537  ORF Transcript_12964/g.19537 Transcript_12964/m.19537 type:complete len:534 (+) Transcript_12964:181-1782(+)